MLTNSSVLAFLSVYSPVIYIVPKSCWGKGLFCAVSSILSAHTLYLHLAQLRLYNPSWRDKYSWGTPICMYWRPYHLRLRSWDYVLAIMKNCFPWSIVVMGAWGGCIGCTVQYTSSSLKIKVLNIPSLNTRAQLSFHHCTIEGRFVATGMQIVFSGGFITCCCFMNATVFVHVFHAVAASLQTGVTGVPVCETARLEPPQSQRFSGLPLCPISSRDKVTCVTRDASIGTTIRAPWPASGRRRHQFEEAFRWKA